jgi:antitoxin VapB
MLNHMPLFLDEVTKMQTERHVHLFRNGRSQAIRIPKEFELEGNEAIIRKDGDRLIIEPVKKRSLRALLVSWQPLADNLPEIKDPPIEAEEIF